jgi:hypothetical protein
MASEKIAAAGTEPAIISFYYTVDSIFDEDSLRTMYQSRNKNNAEGESTIDENSITEDERDIHLGLLEDAVYDVLLVFVKFTKFIPDAIYHNVNYTPSGGAEALTSGLKIKDNAAYNENYVTVIDKNIEKAIRFYILRDWSTIISEETDAVKFNGLHELAMRNIYKHSKELKKVLYSG